MSKDEQDQELLADIKRAIDQVNAYHEELDGESPRAAAILAVANLEDELERLLLVRFTGVTKDVWQTLAGAQQAPLGSLYAKNTLARAFGFYGGKTWGVVDTLGAIRNKFAHEISVRHFNHELVIREFKKLANNPFQPFVWKDTMTGDEIRKIFLEIMLALEKDLLSVRSNFLFPESPPPTLLP